MSLRSDEQFLAAVAAALGESIALIRRRGFHLDVTPGDLDLRPVRRGARQPESEPADAVDFAAYGVDWDANEEDCVYRRPHRLIRRRRRAAA
jgi:hypothetical protein